MKFDNQSVRVYDDLAIVGRMQTFVGSAEGRYVPGPRRITDIWVRQNGRPTYWGL